MSKRTWNISNGGIAILLACLTSILLTTTAPAIGLTWDEPSYIAAAESYTGWFGLLVRNPGQAFSSATIDAYWTAGNEHPPLDKIWSGLVWSLARHVFDDLTARRLGNILLVALLIGLLYFMVAETYGRLAGLFAAAALLSMPRFFFHAHLAALDVPVAVGIFAVTFVFWQTFERKGWGWGILLGVVFGLAEAMKLNATFVPISLFLWLLISPRKWTVVLRIFLMGIFGFLTFLVVWPWLYYHTWDRIVGYIHYHAFHFKIGQWYFGQFYVPPPWHFVFVMTWAVVPLTIMLLAVLGMVRAGNGKKDRGLGWLLIISAFVTLLPFMFGKTLVYDDERLFIPLFPFLAALSGAGFGWITAGLFRLARRVKRPLLVGAICLLLAVAAFLPQSLAMAGLYPHLLSYYSESVGGLPGAAKLGLETTYWCKSYASALPYINANAQSGDRVWVEQYSYDVLIYYQIHGQLRSDITILTDGPAQSAFGPAAPQPVVGTFSTANWFIFQYRQSQYGGPAEDYPVLNFLNNLAPVYELSYRGIPIMQLYHR